MRKTLISIVGILCFAGILFAQSASNPRANYRVIPLPNDISLQATSAFVLNSKVQILYPTKNEKMKKNAAFLSQYLKEMTALELKTTSKKGAPKLIVLSLGLQSDNPDAYKITVDANKIDIVGASESGVFYGIQTIRKSIPLGKAAEVEMPAVVINDAPRFAYRGMMLDVSRHFFSVDEVKTFIDMLALHNVNKFHWHLTEDQGWRIEIKKYPLLTEIGSKRTETVIGHNSGKYDGTPYGGFYTQEQCKEVVAYAADRFITVIPEIDMPGHMLGALAAYPELGCTGGPYEVWRQWGVSEDVLCMGNDKTLEFIKDVLTEIAEIFPSQYIHIGGDECPKTNWKKCPKCQSKITELGLLADVHHSAEDRLQSYFISYAEEVLKDMGRRIIGWDEILEGGLAPNATVMSWRGMTGGIAAAKLGHDVIMTPNTHLYFDYYQASDKASEPIAIGGFSSVETVYSLEPVPPTLDKKAQKHIVGVQANLWTEYIPTFAQVQYMVLPRMAALSEVQWTNATKKDYADFLKRIPSLINIYNYYDYNYAMHLFDPSPSFAANYEEQCLEVSLSTIDHAPIHYTLNGDTPTKASPIYSETLKINKDTDLQAIIFRGNKQSHILSEQVKFNKATLKPITALQRVNPQYKYEGINTLVNGLKGDSNYKTGRWIAFYKNDMEVLIDLLETSSIGSASISTCVEQGDWVFDARSFSVLVSDDGINFSQVAKETYPAMGAKDRNGVYDHKLTFDPVKTRYVKVIAESENSIPEWHGGRGNGGFLFVDEIILE